MPDRTRKLKLAAGLGRGWRKRLKSTASQPGLPLVEGLGKEHCRSFAFTVDTWRRRNSVFPSPASGCNWP